MWLILMSWRAVHVSHAAQVVFHFLEMLSLKMITFETTMKGKKSTWELRGLPTAFLFQAGEGLRRTVFVIFQKTTTFTPSSHSDWPDGVKVHRVLFQSLFFHSSVISVSMSQTSVTIYMFGRMRHVQNQYIFNPNPAYHGSISRLSCPWEKFVSQSWKTCHPPTRLFQAPLWPLCWSCSVYTRPAPKVTWAGKKNNQSTVQLFIYG